MRCAKKIILFLCFLICSLLFCFSAFAYPFPVEDAVIIKEARVRKQMSPNSSKVATLKKNAKVKVTGTDTDKNGDLWFAVETEKGKTGFVRSDFIKLPESQRVADDSAAAKEMIVEVTAKCISKNHVGSAWSKECYCDEVALPEDEETTSIVYVVSEEPVIVRAILTEHDRNPDVGTKTMQYIPTEKDLKEGFTITQEITVRENSGNYKGSAAVWNVIYTFTPKDEEKLSEND